MNPHQLKRLFPNASASVLAANESDYGSGTPRNRTESPAIEPEPVGQAIVPQAPAGGLKPKGKRRRQMNKTEAAYSLILQAKMQAGEIVSFEYEGMTLRWGKLDNIQYTPDFVVFEAISTDMTEDAREQPFVRMVFIETKGGHIWPKDIQKFKQARNEWPLFRFEMWQRKKGHWKQLY